MRFQPTKRPTNPNGFTLTEALVTVGIVGTLSAIAMPNYFNQLELTKQRDATTAVNYAMSLASTFNDEFGAPAKGWNELDEVGTIMAKDGPATAETFEKIILPGGKYTLKGKLEDNTYTFTAAKYNPNLEDETPNKNKYAILGCINVLTGASQVKLGGQNLSETNGQLECSIS